jgi:hypothetical protein
MATRTNRAPKKEPRVRFLDNLRKRPSVAFAAKAAGVGRRTVYEWRETDAEFAAQWDDAIEDALDDAEKKAWDRGLTVSDTLLIFMLKAHRPEKFRERSQVDHRDLTLESFILAAANGDGDPAKGE